MISKKKKLVKFWVISTLSTINPIRIGMRTLDKVTIPIPVKLPYGFEPRIDPLSVPDLPSEAPEPPG